MHIAEDPEVSDQPVLERKESSTQPFDLFSCGFEAHEIGTVGS
jgi:hypothetical protein